MLTHQNKFFWTITVSDSPFIVFEGSDNGANFF